MMVTDPDGIVIEVWQANMISGTPQAVLETFLRAFSRLDLDAMLDCFAPEATAFLPAEFQRARLQGKDAIRAGFAAMLESVRATGATSIPLDAEDTLVEEWGDTALATLHIRTEYLRRRTFVLRRRETGWQIVHVHASNAPLDP